MTTDTPHPDDYALPDGDALRAMREVCGLTQADVAERIGMSTVTVYQYETDRSRPTYATLAELLGLYLEEWPDD